MTDSGPTMAFPRPALAVDDSLLANLAAMVDEESVGLVVVGRPVGLSGNVTASTQVADQLYRSIQGALGDLPVVQWDERLTTVEAQRSLSGAGLKAKSHREHIDSAAAVIMLQNYLDGLHSV